MGLREYYMYLAGTMAAVTSDPYYDMGNCENPYNNYQPAKVGGFTPCKGRKRLSKKNRKKLLKK